MSTHIIDQLKEERKRRGLSLAALAALAGIAPATLSSWEREGKNKRNPAVTQVERWADSLGMRITLVSVEDTLDYAALAGMSAALQYLGSAVRELVEISPTMADLIEGARLARAAAADERDYDKRVAA